MQIVRERTQPPDARQAVESLEEVTRFVLRHTATLSGMSIPALSTLSTLAESGPARITDLAAGEGVSQPSMTTMVARLERLGLVQRRPDPGDARSALIAITDQGHQIRSRRRAGRTAFLSELIDQLDADDLAVLERAAPVLRRLADRELLPAALAAAREAGSATGAGRASAAGPGVPSQPEKSPDLTESSTPEGRTQS